MRESYLKSFKKKKAEGWTFWLQSELAEDSFVSLCSLTGPEFPKGVLSVPSSANTDVCKFNYLGKGYFLKEYLFVNLKKHVKVLWRGGKLTKIARQLELCGFHTPPVVGIGRKRMRRRVITEAVENVRDVSDVLFPQEGEIHSDADDSFLLEFGRVVGRLHQRRFFHGDLRWRNVLTRLEVDGWTFYFIDNDRTRRYRFGLPFRCRVKNLSQILFSGRLLDWPEQDWQIFLQGYSEASGLSVTSLNKLVSKVETRVDKRSKARESRSN